MLETPARTEDKIATVLRIAIKKLTDDKWVRMKYEEEKKTKLIDMMDLLEETTSEMDQTLAKGCLYVKTSIEGVEARFLVDTRAEVSVISDHLLNKMMKLNEKIPSLPVTEIMVNGVVPNQTTKVKKQIMARVEISNQVENITFLVLKGLMEKGIMGYDFLENHEANIEY